jgi:probable addiction module antidote protein
MEIAAWLRGLGLERYELAFRENEIDPEVLPEVTHPDLLSLEMPLGPRRKLLKAIAERRGGTASAAVAEEGSRRGRDPELIGYAPGAVSRSKGMTEIARRTGLGRVLSPEGRPEFATALKVVRALGLKLTVTAA